MDGEKLESKKAVQVFSLIISKLQFNVLLKPLLRYLTIIRGSLQPLLPLNFHELRAKLKRGKTVEMFMLQENVYAARVKLSQKKSASCILAPRPLKLGRDRTQIGAKLDRNLAAEIHV